MDIETRVRKLESANRLYRRLLIGVFSVVVVILFVGANQWNSGTSLTTPVEIRGPAEEVLLVVNDEGAIEFYRRGHCVAKLEGSQVNHYDNTLWQQDAALNKLELLVEKQDSLLKALGQQMKVFERHVQQDRLTR